MFGLGTTEILVILVVALLVLGPQKLPGIARTLGKTLGEFRRVSSEFQRTLNEEVEAEERKKSAPKKTAPAAAAPEAAEKQAAPAADAAHKDETAAGGGQGAS